MLSVRSLGCYLQKKTISKVVEHAYGEDNDGETRTKPPPIWLHSSWHRLIFSLLKCRSLDDFSVPVAHGLAAGEHLESLDLLGIAVKILALYFL